MCGILALVRLGAAVECLLHAHRSSQIGEGEGVPDEVEHLFPALHRRGPDAFARFPIGIRDASPAAGGGDGALWASVLHLRGTERCDQPARDADGNALCWNGEVYGGDVHVPADQSDTRCSICVRHACLVHVCALARMGAMLS